jgi:IMP dehydrogenase
MKKVVGFAVCSMLFCNAQVEIIQNGLSYDDVLLVPQKSIVDSRTQMDTTTKLTKNITVQVPIVSANMSSVTEKEMAARMALEGGIGIIHRYNTIEDQVAQVKQVKRYRNAIISNPFIIDQYASIQQAHQLMQVHGISGLLVADHDQKLVGIITKKDISLCLEQQALVGDLMTPRDKVIVGEATITLERATHLLHIHKLEKLPLVTPDNTIAGLITRKDITAPAEYPKASLDARGRLLVGAAIGVRGDVLERAEALVKEGEVDLLVLDIAHGHCDAAIAVIQELKKRFPQVDIIAGNVATARATRELIEAGADAIKVGIGPGSICTTRIVTGCGYPQLTAVIECSQEADAWGVPVIADGGVKNSGDIVKALAAGASSVMLGSLLAGTQESPGVTLIKHGKKFKFVHGMASLGANLDRNEKINKKNNLSNYVPEGVEAIVPYKGTVAEVVHQLLGGLHSGMSYCGVDRLCDLRGNGMFIVITAGGLRESHAHDVQQLA